MDSDTDSDFLLSFREGRLDPATFHHRDHVRLAFLEVREDPARAAERVLGGIRAFAIRAGAAQIFHVTLTVAWVRLVAAAAARSPEAAGFDAFIARHPELLDKTLPERHYSRELLFSPAAKAAWQEPDRAPLPGGGERRDDEAPGRQPPGPLSARSYP